MVEEIHVVTVSTDGTVTGIAPRLLAHQGQGLTHLAVSVLVTNDRGQILLQRRAASKAAFAGVWANTACTHPMPGEAPLAAAVRRLGEEMGLSCPLTSVGTFSYVARDPVSGLIENEFDHVFVGTCHDEPVPEPSEVSETRWIDPRDLVVALGRDPDQYSPWLTGVLSTAGLWPGGPVIEPPRGPHVTESGSDRVLLELARIGELVQGHIGDLVDHHVAQWSASGGDDTEQEVLSQYRKMALSGGKRLRPAFTYWAYEGAGGDPTDQQVLDAALAVELLHTFALIHDDVMDRAETRRSVETIHVAYTRRHEALGLRGDAVHYGESVAILMGDLAFAHAAELISRLDTGTSKLFFNMCADLMVGQYLDLESAARGMTGRPGVADQITELKTARYTVVSPLVMGATLAGRADDLTAPLTAYGRPVGHAFQMRDDMLGAFGDPALTGKPVGDDLTQGKVTRLLELGLELSEGADRDVLARLGSPSMEPGDEERAVEILTTSGARQAVEETIERLVDEAVSVIGAAPITASVSALLADAAVLIANRDH